MTLSRNGSRFPSFFYKNITTITYRFTEDKNHKAEKAQIFFQKNSTEIGVFKRGCVLKMKAGQKQRSRQNNQTEKLKRK